MKPPVLAGLAACLLVAAPAMAQTVEFGPKVGLTWSDMLGDDSGKAEVRKGFTAGAGLTVPLGESFQIQLEGLYAQKGAQFSSVSGRFDLNTSYVEVPLLARLLFPARADDGTMPYLLAGPAFSFETKCEVETFVIGGAILTQDCEDSSFPLTEETESLDVGVIVGGGVNKDVGDHSFYVEGRVNFGVRSLDDTGRAIDVRNVSFMLLTGFGFGLGG